MNTCTLFDSPLGQILLVSDGSHLTGLYFRGQKHEPLFPHAPGWRSEPDSPIFLDASAQLGQYFSGRRKEFDLPLHPTGTPFQRKIWDALREIPFGDTVSYAQLAARAGCVNSARAVGAAVGRNPISVIVPCHRVIGSAGSLTGYAGGLERKRALLDLEAAVLSENPPGRREGL
jgi:methylated-DNA-[protein]-cysteine S-methyltransferase